MKASARNVFTGKITAITDGTINAEVELTLDGGDKIVAVVTESSVQTLGLAIGTAAVALVKAPWVMLLTDDGDQATIRFSARNQLAGTVSALEKGAVNTEVAVTLPGGTVVHAVITNEAVLELGLHVGKTATALIKASHVILGVQS